MKNRIVHIILMVLLASTAFAQSEMQTIDSLKQAIASQSGREKVETMIDLSWVLADISFDDGVEAGDQAAMTANALRLTDLEAKSYYRNGYLYLYHNDLDLSKEYLHKSMKLFRQIDDKVFLFEVYWCLALGDMRMGNLDSAAYYYDKALDMAEATGDKAAKLDVVNNLGTVYYEQGDWDEAVKCYEECYRLAEEDNDTLVMTRNEMNLAVIYSELGDWQKAKSVFNRTIPIFSKSHDYYFAAAAHKDMGLIYEKYYINYDSALFYLGRAVELADSIGSGVMLSESLNEIGNVFMAQKHYQEAVEKYDAALSVAQSASYPMGQIAAFAGLGEVHYNKGDYSRSLDCYLQCRNLGDKYSISIYETVVRSALIRNYACLGLVKEMEEEMLRFTEDYNELCFQNAGFADDNQNFFKNAENISKQYDELFAQAKQQNRQLHSYRLSFFGLLAVVLSASFVLLVWHFRKKH